MADRFNISPFDILQKPFDEVIAIWQGAVISSHASKQQTGGVMGTKKEEKVERVYSWNANWH